MSDDRTVQSGERRLERIRAERGMPVRRAPIAVGAIAGGALGAWAGGVPVALLAVVRDGLAGAGNRAAVDGASAVREVLLSAASVAWPALACGVAGAVAGALLQTGFRLRSLGGWRVQRPRAAAAGGAAVRLSMALVILASGLAAVAVQWHCLGALPGMPIGAAVDSAARVLGDAVLAALAAGIAFAALDVAVARWRWARATNMTAPEAREERRRSDGDPETRSRRLQVARRRLAGMARGKDLRGQAA